MSVDTKGCLIVENKNVFQIIHTAMNTISELIRKENNGVPRWMVSSEEYGWPKTSVWEFSESAAIEFRYKGEDRQLNMHFDCDSDLKNHEEIIGNSCVWLSLGNWGSSVFLMKSILENLKEFGDVWIDENDCDDQDFYKL